MQQIRAAGNCELTPSLFLLCSGLYIKPALWHYYHEVPDGGKGRERAVSAGSPCDHFVAAGGKQAMLLYAKSPASNYGSAVVEEVFKSSYQHV